MLDLARAESPSDFDPVATAKLRAGEIVSRNSRQRTRRVSSRTGARRIINTGLLLQAGLRALLPVHERRGVAAARTPSPNDPKELILAQENYTAVFGSGTEATAAQRATAMASIELAAQQMEKAGYTVLAKR